MSSQPAQHSALERVLAFSTLTIMALAVAAYLTTLMVGMIAGRQALAESMWPVVVWISYVGLPVGFVLLMVLLGLNYRRRGAQRNKK